MERAQGFCEEGGFTVNTQGLLSTTKVQRSFVSCTVTVYISGTLTLATIFADNALVPTPKANPFTAAADSGWFFYAAGGKYDVRFSGSDVPLAFTRGDWLLCDPFGPNQDVWCASTGAALHNLLSDTHPDTQPYTPPEIGDLIRGDLVNLWERHGVAQVGEVLTLIDVGGGQPYPEWVWPSTLDTCTSVQVNGVEAGCEHEMNYTGGNVTVVATDDSDNGRINVAITAAGSACPDITQVTDLYLATTGNDTTGDGTIGDPWRSIQKAIDAGIPGIVCGRYIIHLEDEGNYTGQNNLSGRIFAGGGTDYNSGDVNWPFSNAGASSFDNTWPYSWVEIVGSTANPDGYVIAITADDTLDSGQAVFSLSHANLTLRGVSIQEGGYGIQAANYSFVNLAGVMGINNQTHVLVTHDSKLYFDESGTVDNAGIDYFSCTNSTLGAVPFAGTRCIEAQEGSIITDVPASGSLLTSTLGVDCLTSGGGTFVNCIRLEDNSYIHMRGILGDSSTNGQFSLALKDSWGIVQEIDANCGGGTGPAITLVDSFMGGAMFTGNIWNISNCTTGVELKGGSHLRSAPVFTNVTNYFAGEGGDTVPNNQRSRDTFLSTAHLIEVLDFSATPTFNMNTNGSIKKITLTDNVTSSTISNQRPGEQITFIICQGGTAKTFAWPANVLGADTIGSTINKCNVQQFVYDQDQTAWVALAPMQKDQ